MNKLKLHTPDLTAANIEKLAALFPNCVTEARDEKGVLKRAIDFDQLRQELSDHIVEGPRERYHLDWPGKREALLAANAPIAKTLRPCREESVDFDTTRNLFIEGDNLDALKLLQETYLGKVKMIYIDPPYNTGNDFIYNDDFAEDSETYKLRTREKDAQGNLMVANPRSNGRFHSDWLSMIYPRLKLAKNLLAADGLLFISIDDNELFPLQKLCAEVFGDTCFAGCVARVTGTPTGGGNRALVNETDYLLIFGRESEAEIQGVPFSDGDAAIYDRKDENGTYLIRSLRRTGGEDRREDRPTMYYPVKAPDGSLVFPIAPAGYDSRWICGEARFKEMESEDLIEWVEVEKNGNKQWQVYQKFYLEGRLKQPSNLWDEIEGNKKATRDLKQLFDGEKVFSFPKPVGLIRHIIKLAAARPDSIVLDFFAGSGTTAQAVWEENKADGGHRQVILVQLPEPIDMANRAQAVAANFCKSHGLRLNIAELTKERLRRSATKLREDSAILQIDTGFRVLKIDTSNMADVYYAPDAVKQADLVAHTDNIKPDRTPEDLLFQVLVDWGVDLSLPITQETIAKKKVFFVDGNALAACFDPKVSEDLVKELAKRKPLRAVFRDSSYDSDSVKINVEQIFKLLSPETEVKSL
jgi:adenine-specific DNA-methyltransferase